MEGWQEGQGNFFGELKVRECILKAFP